MTASALDVLREAGVLAPIDLHFALAMASLAEERDERVVVAAALVSRQVGAGHVCLDLARLVDAPEAVTGVDTPLAWAPPRLRAWLDALRASPLVGDNEAPTFAAQSPATPLVLDAGGRLYLRRYFEHEERLARAIRARATSTRVSVDRKCLDEGLARLFGASPAPKGRQLDLFDARGTTGDEADDPQVTAARTAVERAFCVVSGGPGTGKTSTVVRILALVVEQALGRGEPAPRILLLAPTGKAATRLGEAVEQARERLACEPKVRAALAVEPSTIHRALGARPGKTLAFRHDRERPLVADVVVVDEASMVDLALMARLFDAIPEHARIVLLGDKDQLASVEAGAVLGDICGVGRAGSAAGPLSGCLVELTRSWRYAPDSGIGALARAIHTGDAERALALLRDDAFADVALVEDELGRGLWPRLGADVLAGLTPAIEASTPVAALHALGRFRVLCAHRHGPRGLVALTERIEALLAARGAIARSGGHYAGLPVLVTANDYGTRLFNGDVGILRRGTDERLRACFPGEGDAVREVALTRLPPHEPLYATSVHKSQGSELDEVAVVLPAEPSALTTRELLYTAVTRARRRVTIYAAAEVVRHAIETRVERASGLRDRLWST